MSRIGKLPVPVPKGVKVGIKDGRISVEGPKGKLERVLPAHVEVKLDKDNVLVQRENDERQSRASHGLTRALIANMVKGVTQGFTRGLDIVGVGYRAEARGKRFLLFHLGYSHPIMLELPDGVDGVVQQNTHVQISGIDVELIGQTAATIRGFRPPDAYKGKGIRYTEEHVSTKVGKSSTK